jgi:hypothetical protein
MLGRTFSKAKSHAYTFQLLIAQLIPLLELLNITRDFLDPPSLVIDIPAGDGKTANLFLQCRLSF